MGSTLGEVSVDEVCAAVAAMLGVSEGDIDPDQDLMRLGLDSISVIRLAGRWRREGRPVSAGDLFEKRTIRQWHEVLTNSGDTLPAEVQDVAVVAATSPQTSIPLTPMQMAYWVGRRADQAMGAVAAHFYAELDGQEVDPARLEDAVRAVVARHPMLRAHVSDGRQWFGADEWPGLTVHDLREIPGQDAEDLAVQLRDRLSHRILDLEHGEVFDVQLVLFPGAATRILVDIDMVVADAQSFRVFLADLAQAYETRESLRPLAHGFGDYLAQRSRASVEQQTTAREYWQRRVAELPPPPTLPLRTDPGGLEQVRVVRRWHRLDGDRWDRLRGQARSRGLSVPVTLLTVYALALQTWSEQPDVLINLPSYDRQPLHPDVDELIGDFTSVLPLAVRAAGPGVGFSDIAHAIQKQLHEDLAHITQSGVDVLREIARATGRYDAVAPYVFTSAVDLGELFSPVVRRLFGDPGWTTSQTPQVWLDQQITEREGELFLNWDVVDGLFEPGVIDDMFHSYVELVDRLSDGDAWEAAPVLTPPGQLIVRSSVNATASPLPQQGLADGLFVWAETHPDRTALAWAGATPGSLTYGELADRALRVASLLVQNGIRPQDPVGVCLPKGPEQIVAVLGVLAAGAVYVPISVEQPPARRQRICQSAGIATVLTPAQSDDWPTGVTVLAAENAAAGRIEVSPRCASGDDLAYVLFTSGSTGEPKGVEISHRAAMNTIEDLIRRFGIGRSDCTLAVSALDFDLSVFDVFAPLQVGGVVALVLDEERRDPAAWATTVAHAGVTVVNCVPGILTLLLKELQLRPPAGQTIRLVLLGGDKIDPELAAATRAIASTAVVVGLGGTTETAIHSTVQLMPDAPDPSWHCVPYGTPLGNVQCRVTDRFGRDRPDLVPGELWIGGLGVARGYRGDLERTADRFVTDSNGQRWYRTGDLARYLGDGSIEFLGRADHQVKVAGHRIELGEIEAALQSHPGIATATALAVGEPLRVGAVVTTTSPDAVLPDDVYAFLADQLPPYLLPSQLLVAAEVPLTANGKVDRKALAERLVQQGSDDHEEPQGPIESAVASVWREELGHDIGRDVSFFAAGGDSLRATRVIGRLQELGYREARLGSLFSAPTLSTFSATLSEPSMTSVRTQTPLVPDPGNRYQPFPPTPVQLAYLLGRQTSFTMGGVGSHWYWEFEGSDVDVERIQAAYNRLVRHHDMLRAHFTSDGQQVVLREVPDYVIGVTDTGEGADYDYACDRLRANLSQRIPDPTQWPLIDIKAVRSPGRTRIAFSFDYIVVDALSIVTIFGQLSALYTDPAHQLPETRTRFRDYVIQAHPSQEERDAAVEYWHERIKTLPVGPRLPLSQNPQNISSPRFNRREARLEQLVWHALQERARSEGVTAAAVLAAAYVEALRAWSEDPDLSIVLTLFDRRPVASDIDEVIGDFTSLLVVGAEEPEQPGWIHRVRSLQAEMWAGMEHRAFGAIEVLRDLSRREDEGLVSIPVVFTSALGLSDEVTSMTTSFGQQIWGISQTPQVWLDNQVMERDQGLSINWDSVDSLFPDGVLDAMFQAYLDLLNAIAAGPWESLDPDLTPSRQLARRSRAAESGDGRAQGEEPTRLHQGFFAQAETCPDRPALLTGDEVLTYGQVAERARRLAGELHSRGVQQGDPVGVRLYRGPAQVVAVLGVLAAGAAYVPLGAAHPPARLQRIVATAGIRVAITEATMDDLDGVDSVKMNGVPCGPLGDVAMPSEDTLAYIIFTSGSTGEPKGVEITHGAAMNTIRDVNKRLALVPEDRTISVSALDFDLSVYDIFGPLSVGGAISVIAEGDHREGHTWVEQADRHGVTIWNTVPMLYQMYLTACAGLGRQSALRAVLVSGDWVPLDLAAHHRSNAPTARLVSLGGATEASIWSNWWEIEGVDPEWHSIPYGYPLAGQSYRVVDRRMRQRPDWVTGELLIGGAGVARGYCNDPVRTHASFLTLDDSRWYRTGDMGRYWPNGVLEFLGRRDHQVKVGGHRIELGEIESAANACVGVESSVAFVSEEPRILVLAVRTMEDIPESTLREHIAARVPAYMVPSDILQVHAWPLTANGKVDRKALQGLHLRNDTRSRGAEPPVDELEQELSVIWSGVLNADVASRNSTFFELGGNSLLATELITRLRTRYHIDITLRELFETPTVAAIATTIRQARSGMEEGGL